MNVYFILIAHFFSHLFSLFSSLLSLVGYFLFACPIHSHSRGFVSFCTRILADQGFSSYYMTMQIDECSSKCCQKDPKKRCKRTQCNYFHSVFFSFSLLYHLLSSHKLYFFLGLYHCNVQFQQLRNQKVTCDFHSESEGKEKLTIVVMAKRMLNTSSHERYRHR